MRGEFYATTWKGGLAEARRERDEEDAVPFASGTSIEEAKLKRDMLAAATLGIGENGGLFLKVAKEKADEGRNELRGSRRPPRNYWEIDGIPQRVIPEIAISFSHAYGVHQ